MAKRIDMTEGLDDAVVDETETETSGASGAALDAAVVVEDGVEDEKKATLPKRAIRNDDGTISLPLTEPVHYKVRTARGEESVTLDRLTFHPLYGADLRIMAQQSDENKGPVAFARATRISTPRMKVIFDKLRERDVKAGGDIITFLAE
jgi:hypothetical protein